jgi:hypothetical protein
MGRPNMTTRRILPPNASDTDRTGNWKLSASVAWAFVKGVGSIGHEVDDEWGQGPEQEEAKDVPNRRCCADIPPNNTHPVIRTGNNHRRDRRASRQARAGSPARARCWAHGIAPIRPDRRERA